MYRFSADEFVVLQEESPIGLNEINDTISRGIVASNGEEVRLTVSVGVATVQPASTIDSILQQADAAMYIAKNNGGDQWFQYDGSSDDKEF